MTNFEQTLLKEVSTLPETRREAVLAFVRYLKLNIPRERVELEKQFDRTLKSVRARAKKLKITEKDIEAEIRAVRAEHARRS
jgi:hypothetical protein